MWFGFPRRAFPLHLIISFFNFNTCRPNMQSFLFKFSDIWTNRSPPSALIHIDSARQSCQRAIQRRANRSQRRTRNFTERWHIPHAQPETEPARWKRGGTSELHQATARPHGRPETEPARRKRSERRRANRSKRGMPELRRATARPACAARSRTSARQSYQRAIHATPIAAIGTRRNFAERRTRPARAARNRTGAEETL